MVASVVALDGDEIEQSASEASFTTNWFVRDELDPVAARAALITATPDAFLGLIRRSIRLTQGTADGWNGVVTYGFSKIPIEGEITISVTAEQGRETVYRSIAERSRSADAPPSNTFLGLSPEGEPEGVEIPVSASKLRIEVFRDRDLITDAYITAVERLTDAVNVHPWRGYAAGELRLENPSFSRTIKLDIDGVPVERLTLEFAINRNVSNLVIGGSALVIPLKRGHDLVRVVTRKTRVTVSGDDYLVQEPVHWYCHQMFRELDYKSVLGF